MFHKEFLDSPFHSAQDALTGFTLGRDADALVVDMHCEATSEKTAMGLFLDGKASLVVGSHTHIPTADAHILPAGTAYQSDAGMCGDYNSVIGFDPEIPLKQFTMKRRLGRMEPSKGDGTLCGVIVETNDSTGLATYIEMIRRGGTLQETRSA